MRKIIKKTKVKGFTLVELLAVIFILGLIIIIALPKVMETLNNSKKRTFELTAKSIVKSAEEKYIENNAYGIEEEITCESVSNITSSDFSSCEIEFSEEGNALVTIVGKARYKGLSICKGTKTEAVAQSEECDLENDESGGEESIVAYLYNGVELPALPEWDKEKYPYAVIWNINSTTHRLLVSSELPYAVTSGDSDFLHFPASYGFCDNKPKPYLWEELGYINESHTGYYPGNVVWSNFDLYHEDGTLVHVGSEAVPIILDYVIVTLFDGEVTTVSNEDGTVHVSENLTFADDAGLYDNSAYRITIDGKTIVEDVVDEGLLKPQYLGNAYLADSENYVDNGGLWCLKYQQVLMRGNNLYLYTRTPGTYHLKLESVRG